MHGHRHIDWTGECAGLVIISGDERARRPSLLFLHTDIYGRPARARENACAGRDPSAAADRETLLRGWAYRIRTGESGRGLSDWNCVTTSPEVGASPAAETLRVRAA